MTPTDAVVAIFAMFFFVVFVGMLLHSDLEHKRLACGFYEVKKEPSDPGKRVDGE